MLPQKKAFQKFLTRSDKSHKGDFGKVMIVAGSRGMSGAAALTGMAALRSGAGLVSVAVPASIYAIAAKPYPELMVKPYAATQSGTLDLKAFNALEKGLRGQDVLALGPGLSRNPSTVKLIHKLILHSKVPAVIDADALNAFEGRAAMLLKARAPLFLTPHEKEFERVFGAKSNFLKEESQRIKAVRAAAEKFGIYAVLKGHRSVAASPGGKIFVNRTGNPGMATAGCGDVLTGVLAGLLGYGKDPFETLCLALTAHGLAGDIAAKKKSWTAMTAGDVLAELPAAFKRLGG